MTPSPICRLTTPPKRITALTRAPTTEPRAVLASSASIFEMSSVEPQMSAKRTVTCFCWAPQVSGEPSAGGLLSDVSKGAPQLAQKRAPGRLATEHWRHVFSIFLPQLSQNCPGCMLSPQCGQATSMSPQGRFEVLAEVLLRFG